jgi:hypothetical protein
MFSALPLIADMRQLRWQVRLVPDPGISEIGEPDPTARVRVGSFQ